MLTPLMNALFACLTVIAVSGSAVSVWCPAPTSCASVSEWSLRCPCGQETMFFLISQCQCRIVLLLV